MIEQELNGTPQKIHCDYFGGIWGLKLGNKLKSPPMDPIMANESQPLWVKPTSLEVNLVGREPSKNWDFHGLGMKVYGQVATLPA